jgi:hypothetical protein
MAQPVVGRTSLQFALVNVQDVKPTLAIFPMVFNNSLLHIELFCPLPAVHLKYPGISVAGVTVLIQEHHGMIITLKTR